MAESISSPNDADLRSEMRRNALKMLGAAGLLTGCANLRSSNFWGTLAEATKPAGRKIDRSIVDAIPYASMIARFQGNVSALMVLGDYLPEDRLVWYSAEHQSITTWGPFAVRLLGMEIALRDMIFRGPWSTDLTRMVDRTAERTFGWQEKDGPVITATAHSEFRDDGWEDVQILGENRRLRRIVEKITFSGQHRFANQFWIDSVTKFCWKSRQVVVPTLATFEINITRPPLTPTERI